MIKLTKRQEEILQIVKEEGPISGKEIADKLSLKRATLRPDLAILTMAGNLEARTKVGYSYKESSIETTNKNISEQLVSEYKSHPVVVRNSSSVYDAIVQIFLKDVGAIYVVNDEGNLVGVISRKDLLRASMGTQDLRDIPVNVIMTRMPNIITIRQEETLQAAAKKMIEHHIDSLPVVLKINEENHTYKVVGRITKTTIAKAYMELSKSHTV
ncbi:helix-turn-helix transcriptional regulator [Robertmurraya massiliosenegalensis]|uniref:helix-turn-helix transcriptional regulator n=1 Tax=Robertmurraya TaxID=2837507 RepID=UPI0039A56B03